jgi:hypothetical protein
MRASLRVKLTFPVSITLPSNSFSSWEDSTQIEEKVRRIQTGVLAAVVIMWQAFSKGGSIWIRR